MTSPRVSVVIPTYNRAHFLAEAIESVLAQTFRDWEMIVVDDGSTDDTPRVVERYGGQLTYLRQPHLGTSAGRNAGIARARGQFVAFLDDDDVWLPGKLAAQLEVFERYPQAGIVGCGESLMDPSGRVYYECPAKPQVTYKELVVRYPVMGYTTGALVRKVCFERAGGFDPGFPRYQDWETWLRIIRHYEIRNVERPLIRLRIHDGPRPNADLATRLDCHRRMIERHAEDPADRRKALAWMYYRSAGRLLKAGRPWSAVGHVARSVALCPGRICGHERRVRLLAECLLPDKAMAAAASVLRRAKGAKADSALLRGHAGR